MSNIKSASESAPIRAWLDTTAGVVGILLLVQFLTGILLAFYYVPSVDHAHTTVSYIEKVVSSGSWLRSLHHYGSQWLALFAFLHVVRLFWREAYVAAESSLDRSGAAVDAGDGRRRHGLFAPVGRASVLQHSRR